MKNNEIPVMDTILRDPGDNEIRNKPLRDREQRSRV